MGHLRGKKGHFQPRHKRAKCAIVWGRAGPARRRISAAFRAIIATAKIQAQAAEAVVRGTQVLNPVSWNAKSEIRAHLAVDNEK